MAAPTIFSNDVYVQGELKVARGLTRSNIAPELSKAFPIDLTSLRVWDAFETALGAAGNDDLGITAGAFGTGCPYITSGDLGAAGATTRYARFLVQLPVEYDDGQPVTLRASAGMLTAVTDGSATIDMEAYELNRDTLKSGSDLVTTAATTCDSLTFADKDFVLTPTNLTAGDWLDVRVALTVTDTATPVTAAAIAALEAVMSIRG